MRDFSEQIKQLREYRNKPDKDDVFYKELIKKELLKDERLIYLLNNKELEDAEAENDEYFGINILPFFLIADIQSSTKNFICFETSVEQVSRNNSLMKYQQLIFYVLCHESDNVVKELGSARHDLIASVLIDIFQGSNVLGNQLKLISHKPSTTDNHYATRTLVFSQELPNYPLKNGRPVNLRSGYR